MHDGIFIELNQTTYPNCYLHRSNPNDVARTESSPSSAPAERKTPAPPTTGWPRRSGKAKSARFLDGTMKGRTMYVVPYILGPENSPYSKIGVEITDSALRRREHAHHVTHGQSRARPPRQFREFCPRAAFALQIVDP